MDESNNTGKLVGLGAIVLALALLGFITLNSKEAVPAVVPLEGEPVSTTPEPVPVEPVTPAPVTSSRKYKNGTYTAVGAYSSPGGGESVSVAITLADDVITAATVTPTPATPTSSQYQGKFVSGFQALVVGKKLDEVVLSKVSGSSLTPKGWNDAVAKIKTQAQG